MASITEPPIALLVRGMRLYKLENYLGLRVFLLYYMCNRDFEVSSFDGKTGVKTTTLRSLTYEKNSINLYFSLLF